MTATPWDDGRERSWSPLSGPVSCDAVVVGLGASGLAALEALRARGLSAVGVDGSAVGGGAAGRNGGLLLGGLSVFHHVAVRSLGRSRAVVAYRRTLEELEATSLRWPSLVRRTGSLRIAASDQEQEDCAAHLRALGDAGISAEPYEGAEGVGLLLPDDATIQPLERCRRHAVEVSGDGIVLHEHTMVTSVSSGRVETAAGPIEADHVIVCVDGGLERLIPSLAGRVRSTRLQMLATAPARDVDLPRPVYWRWGYDYWQQLPDGRIALGGGRDLHEPDEWGAAAVPSSGVQRHLDHVLRDVLTTRAAVTHRWAGVVAYTDSRLPVIEVVEPGVVVAGAYSGHGNLIGPLAARAAVALVCDGRSADAELLAGPPLGPPQAG